MRNRLNLILSTFILCTLFVAFAAAQAQTTAPTTEPTPEVITPSTTIWTNLTTGQITAWLTALAVVIGAAVGVFNKLTGFIGEQVKIFIGWWFNTRKYIAEKQKEVNQVTIAKAVSDLIDANKSIPTTQDVRPDIEAQVKAIATGTGDDTTK